MNKTIEYIKDLGTPLERIIAFEDMEIYRQILRQEKPCRELTGQDYTECMKWREQELHNYITNKYQRK